MKTSKVLLPLIIMLSFCSCEIIDEIESSSTIRTAYYWIIADADTYVECVKAGGICVPVEANYAGRPLVTAHNALGVKRSFVNFPLPDFPKGTVVDEAYFEMFHSGTREDGKTDDIFIDVNTIDEPWIADDVHYNNQPIQPGLTGLFQIKLKSAAWSGSSNIATLMNDRINAPEQFHGFVAFIQRPEPGYEKGYYSNNDDSVFNDGLGRAPRILLKVTLPEGANANDIGFNDQHTDINGSRIFGSSARQVQDWPADWEVAILAR